jgi:hypothetical protein
MVFSHFYFKNVQTYSDPVQHLVLQSLSDSMSE